MNTMRFTTRDRQRQGFAGSEVAGQLASLCNQGAERLAMPRSIYHFQRVESDSYRSVKGRAPDQRT